ncbi:MAG: right-handed parallel beta-helix repeat-containing protein [Acidimicrobiales bacterium]|jgi:hypothetical protein
MKMRIQRQFLTGRILRLVALAFMAIAALVVANPVDAGADTVAPPTSISSDCSANAGGVLGTWLNGLPDNSTVEFPTDGCYLIGTSLKVQSTSGLTIVGNGTTLRQASPGPKTTIRPIVLLTLDHDLTMNGLDIDGGYDGANGGVNYEGNYGLLLEADSGVTLAGLKIDDIQGDFIDLNAPNSGFTGTSHALNTNVSVTDSTFKNAGYHGVTVEAADGVLFSGDTFSNIGVDAMDFEYDIYSTAWKNGKPTEAAEDNVTITNDTWNSFGDDWFASIQPQLPGVDEENVVLSDNTVNSANPLLQVKGSALNHGLTITGNTATKPARSTSGGSITKPYVGSTMTISHVDEVNIENNVFPVYDGTANYYPNHPYLAALAATDLSALDLQDNNFEGALGILNPSSSGNTAMTACGNLYGVNGKRSDGAC